VDECTNLKTLLSLHFLTLMTNNKLRGIESVLRVWWLLSRTRNFLHSVEAKALYSFIRNRYRMLFCVHWIKSKILHCICLRFFQNYNLSLRIFLICLLHSYLLSIMFYLFSSTQPPVCIFHLAVLNFITTITFLEITRYELQFAILPFLSEWHGDPQVIPTKVERMQAEGLYVTKAHLLFAF